MNQSNLITNCILDFSAYSEEMLAAINTNEITNWLMYKFNIEAKTRELLDTIEDLFNKKTNVDLIDSTNVIFKKTPIMFYPFNGSNPNYIHSGYYLWVDPTVEVPKTRREIVETLVENITTFQPIMKESEWDGTKKAIGIVLYSKLFKKDLNYNKKKMIANIQNLLKHELVHNEQYLNRLHLGWKDKIKQATNYLGEDCYYNRKDEISAYAMSLVDCYQSDYLYPCMNVVRNMRLVGKNERRVWIKFIKTIFSILVAQGKDINYVKKMMEETGLNTTDKRFEEINQQELAKYF